MLQLQNCLTIVMLFLMIATIFHNVTLYFAIATFSQLQPFFLLVLLYFCLLWLHISKYDLFLLYLEIKLISSSDCINLIFLHIVAIYYNIKMFQCLILRTYVYSHHLMSNEKLVETNSSAFIAACSSACTVSCKLEIS